MYVVLVYVYRRKAFCFKLFSRAIWTCSLTKKSHPLFVSFLTRAFTTNLNKEITKNKSREKKTFMFLFCFFFRFILLFTLVLLYVSYTIPIPIHIQYIFIYFVPCGAAAASSSRKAIEKLKTPSFGGGAAKQPEAASLSATIFAVTDSLPGKSVGEAVQTITESEIKSEVEVSRLGKWEERGEGKGGERSCVLDCITLELYRVALVCVRVYMGG